MTKLDALSISQHLIQIPSYSGNSPEVISFLKNHLENLNFKCNILEYEENESYKVNNLHALFNPTNSKRTLYFAGHTDVVKEGDKNLWHHDPFSATIVGDKIYGRGASDMKCAIACFVAATAEFLQQNSQPNFGIGFLITNDEEADGINGTKQVLRWMQQQNLPITHCLVGEPTNPTKFGEMIKIGRRGSVSFAIKIIGKQGHVAYPQNAVNPISILIDLLKILKDHKLDNGSKFFDPSNLEVTSISSPNLGGNVIPNEAQAAFNVRFNDLHNSQSIIDLVEYACKKSATGFGAKYELNHRISGESFLSEPKSLAQITSKAIEEICHTKPILSTSGGTSDARFIKDYAEIVELGLTNETAHQINEHALISEIEQLTKVYLTILKNFANS